MKKLRKRKFCPLCEFSMTGPVSEMESHLKRHWYNETRARRILRSETFLFRKWIRNFLRNEDHETKWTYLDGPYEHCTMCKHPGGSKIKRNPLPSKDQFESHFRSHLQYEAVQCTLCKTILSNLELMRNHFTDHHRSIKKWYRNVTYKKLHLLDKLIEKQRLKHYKVKVCSINLVPLVHNSNERASDISVCNEFPLPTSPPTTSSTSCSPVTLNLDLDDISECEDVLKSLGALSPTNFLNEEEAIKFLDNI